MLVKRNKYEIFTLKIKQSSKSRNKNLKKDDYDDDDDDDDDVHFSGKVATSQSFLRLLQPTWRAELQRMDLNSEL
jgi:hypothetical protein